MEANEMRRELDPDIIEHAEQMIERLLEMINENASMFLDIALPVALVEHLEDPQKRMEAMARLTAAVRRAKRRSAAPKRG